MANIISRAAQSVSRIIATKAPWGALTSPWNIPLNYNIRDYLKTYGEIGWLFGSVSRIGQAVGESEHELYVERVQKDGTKDREQIFNHPMLDVLQYVNPFTTGYEFKMLTQFYLDLVGNAFWYVVNNRLGRPMELWNISPAYMHPVPDRENFLAGYVFRAGMVEIPFDLDEIVQLKMPNPDNPYWGVGPTQSISVDLQSESFSSRWNRNYFYNDAAIGTTIVYPDEIDTDEYNRIKSQWQTRHQGLGRAHKVAILSGGAKIEKAVISQRDMDFWKLRKLNRDNILGAFGMPLSVMGISENVNRANAESGEYVFARWTVKPRLKMLSTKLTEQFATRYDPKLVVEFSNPVPQDRKQLQMETDAGLKSGRTTINEARQSMGDGNIEGGDVLLIPNNVVVVRIENNKFPEELPTPASKTRAPAAQEEEATVHKLLGLDQKENYWYAFVERAAKLEKTIEENLKGMFASQLKEAQGNLTLSGGADQTLINQQKARADYTEAVTEELTKLVSDSFEDAEELIPPEQPDPPAPKEGKTQVVNNVLTKQNPEPFDEAMKWLKTRIGWAAEEVSEETAKLLADQLAAGYAEGESIPELSKRVDAVFTYGDKTRAKMIARTETIMAANEGALRGYESVEVERVEYVAALDERTDDDCRALDGEIFDVDDAHGMIPIHPNCRCTWVPVVE